ncbi:hypothetical protein WS68_02110 [Burkholderia sp. TSV86]|nr:hypothetical protein WS68_02110 [Burkholderia sp. TSV86]
MVRERRGEVGSGTGARRTAAARQPDDRQACAGLSPACREPAVHRMPMQAARIAATAETIRARKAPMQCHSSTPLSNSGTCCGQPLGSILPINRQRCCSVAIAAIPNRNPCSRVTRDSASTSKRPSARVSRETAAGIRFSR